jgi:hypothetical protein
MVFIAAASMPDKNRFTVFIIIKLFCCFTVLLLSLFNKETQFQEICAMNPSTRPFPEGLRENYGPLWTGILP